MQKESYFHNVARYDWPTPEELRPYFAPSGQGWFHGSGNDSAYLQLQGAQGTESLREGHGRVDIELSMWGIPECGVLLIYKKSGAGRGEAYCSKGDLTRLRELVRTRHDDPMPVGLFIPFPNAWLAVKEFIETDGQLPKSIEWIKSSDLPPDTFPDP